MQPARKNQNPNKKQHRSGRVTPRDFMDNRFGQAKWKVDAPLCTSWQQVSATALDFGVWFFFYLLIRKLLIGPNLMVGLFSTSAIAGSWLASILFQTICYQVKGITFGQWILYQKVITQFYSDDHLKNNIVYGKRVLFFHAFIPVMGAVMGSTFLNFQNASIIDYLTASRVIQTKNPKDTLEPDTRFWWGFVSLNLLLIIAMGFQIALKEDWQSEIEVENTQVGSIFSLQNQVRKMENLGIPIPQAVQNFVDKIDSTPLNLEKIGKRVGAKIPEDVIYSFEDFKAELKRPVVEWNFRSYELFDLALQEFLYVTDSQQRKLQAGFKIINTKQLRRAKSNGNYLTWIRSVGKVFHPMSLRLLNGWVHRSDFGPDALTEINHLLQVKMTSENQARTATNPGVPLIKRALYKEWVEQARRLEKVSRRVLKSGQASFELKMALQQTRINLREFFYSGNLKPSNDK